jgi:TolB protein
MSNRISFGFKAVVSVVAVMLVGLLINTVVSQMRDRSVAITTTQTSDGGMPISSQSDDRLLAFTSTHDGNHEIYTIHADGSGLTNLTNNPAFDNNPYWSPDGKWIAFESNRTGFTQIYVMEADGSNVIQITKNNADHLLPLTMDFKADPWSPDGNTLLFLQQNPGEDTWVLKSITLNGLKETQLVTGRISHSGISWSPDGNYVGLIQNDAKSDDANDFVAKLYVVRADGSNPQDITDVFQPNERLFASLYSWSADGQSISLVSYWRQEHIDETKVYEVRLDDHSVTEKYSTNSLLNNWQDAMTVAVMPDSTWLSNWVRPDGTSRAFNPTENCQPVDNSHSEAHISRSSLGSWVMLGYCSNGDHWLYWANTDGTTIKQLMNSSLHQIGTSFISFAWSPDDRYIAFNFASPDKTIMYILNVDSALQDPSVQPEQVIVANSEMYTAPSWQPISKSEVVEEKTTPEPPETSSSDRLIAFTSSQNGNLDIYSMRANSSELTNLTNNPADDVSPVWSPDGRRIAFESDRNGFRQIFLMNADGSNVVQLTPDEDGQEANQDPKSDQWIGEPYNLSLNLWSPDGKKLVFLEMAPGNEKGTLYTIDANGENKKPLVEEAGIYSSPSWSPDGKHIAFIAREDSVTRIYSTDADGNNITNVTKKLPSDETLYPVRYSWSREGQSISFIASDWNYLLGGGSEGSQDHQWMAYEASLDGNTLIANATARSQIGGYWEKSYFLAGSATAASSPEFTWVRSDGTITATNPIENCQSLGDSTGYSTYKQSPNGDVVIGAYCPNGDKWLYWANSEGTFKPLLNSPIHGVSDSNAMHLWAPPDFIWSPDDQHIAFNIFSLGKTELYIVNVTDALDDPSTQPFQITIGIGSLYYSPSWQPVSVNEVVEEKPAPEPTPEITSKILPSIGTNISNGEWIAFIGGKTVPDPANPTALTTEQDVFLIHPDGSGLLNITNSPDYYVWPKWSPNGNDLLFLRGSDTVDILRKVGPTSFEVLVSTNMSFDLPFEYHWSPKSEQIAFIDNRAGNYDIYTVYADGRNDTKLAQLTNDPAQDVGFVWSPDGSQIAFQRLDGNILSIHVMNNDGSDQHEIAHGTGKVMLYWSHDGKAIYASGMEGNQIECEGCAHNPAIYRIDLDGLSVEQIYYEPESNQVGFYLYDTPQNMLYFMRVEPQPFLELWGTWFRADNNPIQQINKFDPHQTCKTTDGNILSEDISPNQRFSVITNYCAGGFDLYLADREALEPELVHLLRLPLDTQGQGGDFAYLPITWSPDGRWIVYDNGIGSMLLLDIEKLMQDPDTQPVHLIQPILFEGQSGQLFQSPETIFVIDLVWQPNQ